ncbi:hypothetical protein POWCR01_000127200 [Plasmodium ovale]|uniref:Uncharacterized protein n=1 Tax=Plasmodium ovale TaxID=36330 RepID=A0A1C3KIP9_PLAOA|nr:hypothetical protein POWCR01_000127200 [Plasmodium ovale]
MCDHLSENLKTVDISISANDIDRLTVNDLFDFSSKITNAELHRHFDGGICEEFGIFGYAFHSFRGKKRTTEKFLTEEERGNLIENSEHISSCL